MFKIERHRIVVWVRYRSHRSFPWFDSYPIDADATGYLDNGFPGRIVTKILDQISFVAVTLFDSETLVQGISVVYLAGESCVSSLARYSAPRLQKFSRVPVSQSAPTSKASGPRTRNQKLPKT